MYLHLILHKQHQSNALPVTQSDQINQFNSFILLYPACLDLQNIGFSNLAKYLFWRENRHVRHTQDIVILHRSHHVITISKFTFLSSNAQCRAFAWISIDFYIFSEKIFFFIKYCYEVIQTHMILMLIC